MDVAYARSWSLGLDLRCSPARRCQLLRPGDHLMRRSRSTAGNAGATPSASRSSGSATGARTSSGTCTSSRRREVVWRLRLAARGAREDRATAIPAVRAHDEFDRRSSPTDAVDAVAIATPVGTHYPLAPAALEAGKHVFVEKPLAASSSEAADAGRARRRERARR